MSLAPENAKERRLQYETDPTFGMVMDTLCRMAVDDENSDRTNVALDFFLFGIAIVIATDKGLTLFDPEHCSEIEYGVSVKPKGMDEIEIPALILRMEEEHPTPCVEFERLRNVDPWIKEWKRANAELDNFLQERSSR